MGGDEEWSWGDTVTVAEELGNPAHLLPYQAISIPARNGLCPANVALRRSDDRRRLQNSTLIPCYRIELKPT